MLASLCGAFLLRAPIMTHDDLAEACRKFTATHGAEEAIETLLEIIEAIAAENGIDLDDGEFEMHTIQ